VLAGGGLKAVDGLHLVADEQRAVGQVNALDAGDQVAVLGVAPQVAARSSRMRSQWRRLMAWAP
jgi:hypothetical protein